MSVRTIGRRPPAAAGRLAFAGKLAVAGALAIAVGEGTANATVYSQILAADFTSQPTAIDLGGGSFIFTDIPNTLPGDPPAAVSTTGGVEVTSFLGGVADFGAGASIDQNGELYDVSAFATPTVIPYSAADDFIGLSFSLADGIHYGYAEVDGTELVSYGFQSVPATTILTGAVPEPASMALLATGVLALAGLRLRGQRNRTSDASFKR